MPLAAYPGWCRSYWYGPPANRYRRRFLGEIAGVVLSLAGMALFRSATLGEAKRERRVGHDRRIK
jgi:hypothetical protein